MQNNVGQSFNLNVSRNIGSGTKSPINSNRISRRERSCYNNNSYINNSIDHNDDDRDIGTNDILSGLNENRQDKGGRISF